MKRAKLNSQNITGRDGYIMAQALAYAIEAIEHLPDDWQEWSDKEDMKSLLNARWKVIAKDLRIGARGHLEQIGWSAALAKSTTREVLVPLQKKRA